MWLKVSDINAHEGCQNRHNTMLWVSLYYRNSARNGMFLPGICLSVCLCFPISRITQKLTDLDEVFWSGAVFD